MLPPGCSGATGTVALGVSCVDGPMSSMKDIIGTVSLSRLISSSDHEEKKKTSHFNLNMNQILK